MTKLKQGDNIIVTAGKDKGKKGKVVKIFPDTDRVLIDGVNVVKKHQKPTQQSQHGQIVEKSLPIHLSNVMIADPKTGKPTRIGIEKKDGKRVRIAKKSGTQLK